MSTLEVNLKLLPVLLKYCVLGQILCCVDDQPVIRLLTSFVFGQILACGSISTANA